MTSSDPEQAPARASANLVLGEVTGGGLRYTARALGSFQSVQELRELAIDERGLRLGEIAEVNYEEPPIRYGRHLNRKDAIALTVFKESTANTVEVVHAVMGVIETDINDDPLLQGVDLFVWQDQAEQIEGALNGLTRAGLIGALFAVGVLYFFLRPWARPSSSRCRSRSRSSPPAASCSSSARRSTCCR